MQQSTHAIRILKKLPLVKPWEVRLSMLNPSGMFFKRCFDIAFSIVACLAIAFFIPVIALIIKLQSRGPIFFVQDRTGMFGRTFRCLKFRTMRVNGECNTRQCTKEDPRVFPFGRFLRRTNLDESASVLQRPYGRYEHCQSTAPYALPHPLLLKAYSAIYEPSFSTSWHHRMGTGDRLPWRDQRAMADGRTCPA